MQLIRTDQINGLQQYVTNLITTNDTNTITRLRGTTSGTFVSGDITFASGSNTTITQSGNTITFTSTDTTYSAGTSDLLVTGSNTTTRVWSANELDNYMGHVLGVQYNKTKHLILSNISTKAIFRVDLLAPNNGLGGVYLKVVITSSYNSQNANGVIILEGGWGQNVGNLWNNELTCTLAQGKIVDVFYIDPVVKYDTENKQPYLEIHKKYVNNNAITVKIEYTKSGDGVINPIPSITQTATDTTISLSNKQAITRGLDVSSNLYEALTINRNSDSLGVAVDFTNNSRKMGQLNFDNNGVFRAVSGSSVEYFRTDASGIVSNAFKRNNSSDSYMLLGGGGHKLLSDFVDVSNSNYFLKKFTVSSSYVNFVILLFEYIENTTGGNKGWINAKFLFRRYNGLSGTTDQVEVVGGDVYSNNPHAYFSSTHTNLDLVKVVYNSKKYVAIRWRGGANYDYSVEGVGFAGDSSIIQKISFYEQNAGTVLNAEINDSVVPFVTSLIKTVENNYNIITRSVTVDNINFTMWESAIRDKSGNNRIRLADGGTVISGNSNSIYFRPNDTSSTQVTIDASANVLATSFIKSGGTSAQFLKADGSIDSTAYTTDAKARASLITSTSATGTSNVATTNTNTYMNIVQNSTSVGSSSQITGSGSVVVSSDTNGKLTITGTDTTYSAGTTALLDTGSDTANRVWPTSVLKTYFNKYSLSTHNHDMLIGENQNTATDANLFSGTMSNSLTMKWYGNVKYNTTNLFPNTNNANGILHLGTHQLDYWHQLGFSSNENIYHRHKNGTWAQILTTNQITVSQIDSVVGNNHTHANKSNLDVINQNLATSSSVNFSKLGLSTFGSSWINGHLSYVPIRINNQTTSTSYFAWIAQDFSTGAGVSVGTLGENLYISFATASDISSGNNNSTKVARFHKGGVDFASGVVNASSFIKSGGTSSQFLKADGSSDSNSYLQTSVGLTTNLDTTYTEGIYHWSTSTTGRPTSYGTLLNIVSTGNTHNNSTNWLTQLGFGSSADEFYFRNKTNNSTFNPWAKVLSDKNTNLDSVLALGNTTSRNTIYSGTGSIISTTNSTSINHFAYQTHMGEDGTNITGVICIKHANNRNATMFDTVVKIYGYNSRYIGEYRIAFYQYNATTIHATAGVVGYVVGNVPSKVVRVGIDADNKISINIGDTTTAWGSHVSITLERVETKHNGGLLTHWYDGWSHVIETATTGYQSLVTIPMTDVNANTDTTYSAGTTALLDTGTDTANRVWPTSVLKTYFNKYSLTTHNHDSTYLKLSGGTLTISDYNGLILKRNHNTFGSSLSFSNLTGTLGYVGFGGSGNIIISNGSGTEGVANMLNINSDGTATFYNSITATSFIKSGGTSAQFLKADGSIDSTAYTTDAKARASLITSTSATGTSNVVTTNTNTYMNVVQNGSSVGSSSQITGAGSVTVSSDANGKLTITGTNTDTTYSAGTTALLDTGSDTANRVWPTSVLKTYFNKYSLSTHNHDSVYLKLSGGTLTGALTVNALIKATNFENTSLRRLKENIVDFDKSGIDLVDSLTITTFDRRDTKQKDVIGIIADDTRKEFLNDNCDAVDLYKTIFIQAKAIQELNEKIEKLTKIIEKITQ